MADVTSAQVAASMSLDLAPDIIGQIYRSATTLALLPVEPPNGKVHTHTVSFGEETQATPGYAEAADFTDDSVDEEKLAQYNHARYKQSLKVTGDAQDIAGITNNPVAARNQLLLKIQQSASKLAATVNKEILHGTGAANRLVSLLGGATPALSDTAIYAGIDPTVDTQWKANIVDAGATALSFAHFDQAFEEQSIACEDRIDVMLCAPQDWTKIKNLFDAKREYNIASREVEVAGRKVHLSGGAEVIDYNGVYFIKERSLTAGNIVGLSLRPENIAVSQLPAYRNQFGDRQAYVDGSGNMQLAAPGDFKLSFAIKLLSTGGDYTRFALMCKPFLAVKRRNAHFLIKNFT